MLEAVPKRRPRDRRSRFEGMADLGILEVEGAYEHAVGEARELEPGPDDRTLDVIASGKEGVDAVVLEKVAVDRAKGGVHRREPRIC